MNYKVAIKLGDSYGKEKRGYLASSRIRGHWLAKYWPECDDIFYPENFRQTSEQFFQLENQLKILQNYDYVILNKTYEWKLAEALRQAGKKVIVDMCDPDHLDTHSSPQRVSDCQNTLANCDAVVVNSQELKKSVGYYTKAPIYIVPDRMDLQWHRPRKARHRKKLKYLVWYGYSENLRVLEPYLADLIEAGYEIKIISDKFFENFWLATEKNPMDSMTYRVWHPQTANQDIVETDCVFIGEDKDPYLAKWKSNNRVLTGWALKMPVAFNLKDLRMLQTAKARRANAEEGHRTVCRDFDIRQSVEEYRQIIKELQ